MPKNNESPIEGELSKVVRELTRFAENHGQIYDPVAFTAMCAQLELIDQKHGTQFKKIVCDGFVKYSRSAPVVFENYVLKVIKSIGENLVSQMNVIEQQRKKTPVVHM